MGSMKDKAKGLANEAIGNVKQVAGRALDNKEMEMKGMAQERKGEAQQLKGKAKDKVKNVVDKA